MKNALMLFIATLLLVLIMFSACNSNKSETLLPELIRAESIMYQRPDSALRILEQMPVPSASDRLQNATWCLLMTQAKYKNYIKQPSDSLINIACDYFMEQDDPQRKALTLYYKGVLQEERAKVEDAVKYYLNANKYVDATNDYQLGYLINVTIGNIYSFRYLTDKVIDAFKEANRYAVLSKNKVYIAGSLSYLGRAYCIQRDWDKSIYYYKLAVDTAREIPENRVLSNALHELSTIYKQKKQNNLALNYDFEALTISDKEGYGKTHIFLNIGDNYRLIGKTDSAFFYLTKAVSSDNIYTKQSACQALYYLNRDLKEYESAIKYSDKFWLYTDSIQKTDRSKALIEMQDKYEHEKLQNEKNQLKIEKDVTIRYALFGAIIMLAIIAVLIYVYQHTLVQKERKLQKNEKQIQAYLLSLHENELLISRNQNYINELVLEIEQNKEMQDQLEDQKSVLVEIEKQNDILQQENQVYQDEISKYSSSLRDKATQLETIKLLSEENLYLHDREKFLCDQVIMKTEVLNNLKQSSKHLNEIQWKHLCIAINNLYDNFTVRLSKQFPSLTENDIRICCLIKLHLSVSKMSELLSIEPTSVSKNKQRIKERIIQDLGKPLGDNQTVDAWLWEY